MENPEKINLKKPHYICVLDFEATCDNISNFKHEIIEFPSVLLESDGTNYIPVTEFQEFCRPLVNPVVTKFCNELTGITQEQVDNGNNFIDSLKNHEKWLYQNTGGDVIILTCGFWDLGIMLVNECRRWHIIPPNIYLKVINIKKEFTKFYNKNGGGMASMLKELNIVLEGRHHSGIADCRNITKILQRMIADGYSITEQSIIPISKDQYKLQHPNRKKHKYQEDLIKARLAI